jgi:hypothetical protein
MNSCLCVNWICVREECFLWYEKSAPSFAARARRAPCLVVSDRGVCVCFVLYVCASDLRLVYLWGMGSPRVCGMRVYGHVQWPIVTSEPVVYIVSGGWPSATWFARVSARSLPREWLWAFIFPRCVRMPAPQRVIRVCVIDMRVSR